MLTNRLEPSAPQPVEEASALHVLIAVFFRARGGGLHENVLASVRFLLRRGHAVTVVCRGGPFARRVERLGGTVIETDFSPFEFGRVVDEATTLHEARPIDLVHVHPFASRKLGLCVARVLGLPVVSTFHGQYADDLDRYADELDAVFAVSEGIRQYLVEHAGTAVARKIHVLPNAPDAKLFAPKEGRAEAEHAPLTLSLVSRLDEDKRFVLDLFYAALAHTAENHPGRVRWQVVGDGTLRGEVEAKAEELTPGEEVAFVGWKQGKDLRDAYHASDAVLGPGRCALEAMSCGLPVIAFGSKGYVGLVEPARWHEGVYGNFGGIGQKHDAYEEGAVERDLDLVLSSSEQRQALGAFGRRLVSTFFDLREINGRLLRFYELVKSAHRARPPRARPSGMLELRLRDARVEHVGEGRVRVEVDCTPGDPLEFAFYLERGGEVVEKRRYQAEPTAEMALPGPGEYAVRCFLKDDAGTRASFRVRVVTAA